MSEDRFDMMYCDNVACRVNEFERGNGLSAGYCPACEHQGVDL